MLYDQYDQPIKDKTIIGNKVFLLADLSTKQLTLTFENATANCVALCAVIRLDKIVNPVTGQPAMSNYDPLVLDLKLDGSDSVNPISAVYYNLNAVGGYYLIGTGGETSNWSQVHRAAEDLLAANETYKDIIAAGTLSQNKDAMDALTGGLLYTSMNLYFSRFRDSIAKLGDINHVKTPIDGFVGVVSSVYDVEFVDGTAFSVLPGGLLIDMKGQQLNGNWRDNAAATLSNKNFELIGHIMSSLEHEIWQELTGYDAISTVRGIQMALANGGQLANPKKIGTTDTLLSEYSKFGFSTPTNGVTFTDAFKVTNYSLYGWVWSEYNRNAYANLVALGATRNHSREILKKQVSASTSSLRRARVYVPDDVITYPDSIGDFTDCYHNKDHRYLHYQTGLASLTIVSNYRSCGGVTYSGSWYSFCEEGYDPQCPVGSGYSLWHAIQKEYRDCFLRAIAGLTPTYPYCGFGIQAFNYRDFLNTEGAAPFVLNEYVIRTGDTSNLTHSIGTVASIRDNLYLYNAGLGLEYLIPSIKTQTANNLFTVYIAKQWSGSGLSDLGSLSFNIQNWGGGYVEPSENSPAVTNIPGE